MTYGQDPMMLAKKGNSWNPSRHEQTIDPALLEAIARIMSQQGMRQPGYSPGFQEGLAQGAMEDGFQRDAGLANQMYAPARGFADPGFSSPDMTSGPQAPGGAVLNAVGDTFRGVPGTFGPGSYMGGRYEAMQNRQNAQRLIGTPENPNPQSPIEGLAGAFQGETFPDELSSGPSAAAANEGLDLSPRALAEGGLSPKPKKPGAKKKGEYSDFFKLLKAAKSGDKNTKKSIKDLAKQLEASGGEVSPT